MTRADPHPADGTAPGAAANPSPAAAGPGPDSEITWLLHRAAQRMRVVVGDQADRHGLNLREHIILSALHKSPGLTQIELGRALGLDKTTLAGQLDRLERAALIERRPDPRDRRARLPVITTTGEARRAAVAAGSERVEAAALQPFSDDQVALLRRMLFGIIGVSDDPGSCL